MVWEKQTPCIHGSVFYFIIWILGTLEDLCGRNRRMDFHVLQISRTREKEEPGVEHEDNAGRRDQIILRIVFLK